MRQQLNKVTSSFLQLLQRQPDIENDISPCTLPDVARVNSVKLLCVYLD